MNKEFNAQKREYPNINCLQVSSILGEHCCVYLHETVTSIFVAGTVELTGSKSLIVAIARVFLDHLSIREVRAQIEALIFLRLQMCWFHPHGKDARRVERPASGVVVAAAAGCLWWSLKRS